MHGILSHRIKNPDYAYLTLSLNFYIVWSEHQLQNETDHTISKFKLKVK
jgi:hypothetical protein